ncbi:hypothetical protein M404DRAFT_1005560 [Pisolithus tinctorius Marx 270]|uniref:Uncharacterized protein n=1 Tax=Pisolithus tinctorius Marx 270 TaxID=870435 RepID=A0A0C3NAS8_PISTI|nr:hypothetical protein M404DRAFT_1005560 [Pisolithus tinctorius Marx 270]
MWDQVGSKRRTILQDRLEKEFKLQGKVRREKFDNTPELAWAIVERLGDEKKALSLQKKMVDDKTTNLREISRRNQQAVEMLSM